MKTTLITTFAIAVMISAFNTNPVMAGVGHTLWSFNQWRVDELKDPVETDGFDRNHPRNPGNEGDKEMIASM